MVQLLYFLSMVQFREENWSGCIFVYVFFVFFLEVHPALQVYLLLGFHKLDSGGSKLLFIQMEYML